MKLQDLATDVEMEDEMEDGIENDFGDSEVGEIPAEIAMKILGKTKEEKDDKPKDFTIKKISIKVTGGNKSLDKTVVLRRNSYGNWKMAFKEGGELPAGLQGSFTNPTEAQVALDNYIVTN